MSLDEAIIACRRCPRLVEWREEVARTKRKAFADWTYWGRPVPNFGDPEATRLIVGLAPAAHGANRTGRMFTGDRSGDWLYRALHRAGVANQPTSDSVEDGLQLHAALITAVCHCAPPDNKPTPSELDACRPYLAQIIDSRPWRAVLCLGGIAWNSALGQLQVKPIPKFAHGASWIAGPTQVFASYHPSQQNTFTGRLTEEMLDEMIARWASC